MSTISSAAVSTLNVSSTTGDVVNGTPAGAVSTANARGCDEFLAHVQAQNEALFRRLGWTTLDHETLHGRPHCLMRADLAAFPPHPDPVAGERLAPRSPR